MNKFNSWLGDKISYWLSTMAVFYVVVVLILTPLIWQQPQGIVGWAQYIISVFFQGAALPVLGYVARVSGERQEKILKETHDMVMNELNMIKQHLKEESEQRKALQQILERTNEIQEDLEKK